MDWYWLCGWSWVAGVVVGTVGFEPFDGGVGVDFDSPSAFMDKSMMVITEQDSIVDVGLASELPPVDMMRFGGGDGSVTGGVSAVPVAVFQGSTLGFCEGP